MAESTQFVLHERHGDVHLLRLNNPPVNTLRNELRAQFAAGIAAARTEGARGLVIAGAGRMFCAGAELREIGTNRPPPLIPDVLAALEDFPGVVVAAVHGAAHGGGMEVALACHARLAAPGTQFALPEVKRGLIPGAGGTQRLPRLIGGAAALRFILAGEPVDAARAVEMGFVDAVVDGDLEATAIAWARNAEGRRFVRARDRTDHTAGADLAAFDALAAELTRRTRGQESPLRCVASVRNALTLPFDQGITEERRISAEAGASLQSKALRHVFFGEREVQRVLGMPADVKPLPVSRVVIIGAGTMGGGIAMSCANFGVPVTVVERDAGALEKGIARCRANWQRTVESGRLAADEMARRAALLTGSTSLDVVAEADLVIEAIYENLDAKRELFAELDRRARPGVVLASNTSTLSIDKIAEATRRPELVVGMHFFSPANVMRLLEIVRGKASSPAAIATAIDVGRRIGKVNVVVGNCDGFVGNRMTGKRGPQIERLLLEGCLPQDVDRVMEAYGMAMGPLATGDLAGLDIGAAVRKARGTVAPVADAIVAAGRLGQKTGAGYYKYDEKRRRMPDPEVERMILAVAAKEGITRRQIGDEEILERVLLPMVNEGARILEEGIAQRAIDIDVIFVNGFGWPAWRGGPMFWADSLGAVRVRDRLAHYAQATGDANLVPTRLIEDLAARGGSFTLPPGTRSQ
ncbi:MAG: enoyl-CoA hydratase/isomerase family protein [Burkholderiales bacterium]|nr:enoyl-CoA hydratase/isomerase family protein [Burkholderiales bacterium]